MLTATAEAQADHQTGWVWPVHTLGRLCVCSTASLGADWRCCVHVGWLRRVRVMRAGIEAPKSCWWVQRLFNMSTITREWVALQHAHLMPFRWAGAAPDKGGGCSGEGMFSTPNVCSAGNRGALPSCCLLIESVIPLCAGLSTPRVPDQSHVARARSIQACCYVWPLAAGTRCCTGSPCGGRASSPWIFLTACGRW